MRIGQELKSARLKKGLDLTEIEEALKIRLRFLQALEKNEFDILPGPAYVKGFIRSYAKYVGLDPQALIEEYKAIQPAVASSKAEPINGTFKFNKKKKASLRSFTIPAALITIVFFMTIFLAYLGYQDSLQSQKLEDKKFVDKQLKQLEKPAKHKKKKKKHKKVAKKTNLFKIRLVAEKPTWIRIRAKNKTIFSGYLKRSKKLTFISREPLEVMAGRGSNIIVYQDNARKGPMSDSPTIATKVYKKVDNKKPDAGH